VLSDRDVGGFIGYVGSSQVDNCFSRGSITLESFNFDYFSASYGCFFGFLDRGSRIDNSYSTGLVVFDYEGRCLGTTEDTITGGNVYNSYFDKETTQCGTFSGNAKFTSEMKDSSTFIGWDFDKIWAISDNINDGYSYLRYSGGQGTVNDPFIINSINDIHSLMTNPGHWGMYFLQTADIDASSSLEWNSGAGLIPIGNESIQFTGEYDGAGHRISNIYINRPLESNVGFFGYTNNATLKDVHITSNHIEGLSYVGGVVGKAENTAILNSSFGGQLLGLGDYSGALVGLNSNGSQISNCFSSGIVSGTNFVGGLVGSNDSSSITNSYASSGVILSNEYAGGLVGKNENIANISNCYSTGTVKGGANVGGVIGLNTGSNAVNSFYDSQTTDLDEIGIGSDDNNQTVVGLTTQEFKLYDFGSIWPVGVEDSAPWIINQNGRPFLYWQQSVVVNNNVPNHTITGSVKVNTGKIPFETGVRYAESIDNILNIVWVEQSTPYESNSIFEAIPGLDVGKNYYAQAYIKDVSGSSYYGDLVLFNAVTPQPPSVTTQSSSNIGPFHATLNGTLENSGISNATQYGFCWSTTPNPTFENYYYSFGGSTVPGTFQVNLQNLEPNVTYYVRAYAINELGIFFGNEVDFFTLGLTQEISFDHIAEKSYGDPDFTLNATASSGLPVTYNIVDNNVATLTNNTVKIVGAG
jgi:hypothetical protein